MIIIFSFFLSILLYPYLPEYLATHWKPDDTPDRFVHRSLATFAVPFSLVIFYYLFKLLPNLDPYSENIKSFQKYYDRFLLVLIGYFFYIHFVVIIWNGGIRFSILQFIAPAFGMLLYHMGKVIDKTKRNYLIGIANPWSMHDEKLWKKTHTFAATIFRTAGIFTCFGFLFHNQALYFILAPLLFAIIYTYLYSYHEFKLLYHSAVNRKRID